MKYRFIYGISHIDETFIAQGINIWDSQKMAKKAMTLSYLGAIIRSNKETAEASELAENKMRGTNPPDLTTKEKKESDNAITNNKRPELTLKRRGSRI